jgi:hypothetical protein
MTLRFAVIAAAAGLALSAPAAAATPGPWESLVQVKSKRADAVYLLPGADFRPYTKVMLDPTEVAFKKGWQRQYNSSTRGLGTRISDEDMMQGANEVREGFERIFAETFTEAGYQVVNQAGPDVLKIRTAVVNLVVAAPDKPTAGRNYVFSVDAGEATLILEARDSMTGALLGGAADRRAVGDTTGGFSATRRTSVSNKADFESMFKRWGKGAVNGLAARKASGPGAAANAAGQ